MFGFEVFEKAWNKSDAEYKGFNFIFQSVL